MLHFGGEAILNGLSVQSRKGVHCSWKLTASRCHDTGMLLTAGPGGLGGVVEMAACWGPGRKRRFLPGYLVTPSPLLCGAPGMDLISLWTIVCLPRKRSGGEEVRREGERRHVACGREDSCGTLPDLVSCSVFAPSWL